MNIKERPRVIEINPWSSMSKKIRSVIPGGLSHQRGLMQHRITYHDLCLDEVLDRIDVFIPEALIHF